MIRRPLNLAALGLAATIATLAACGSGEEAGGNSPGSEPAAGAAEPAASATPDITEASNAKTRTPGEGVGGIKGVLNSPYARVAEGVVYVEQVSGSLPSPGENPVMDQKNKIFTPHLLPVLVNTTVDFPNSDDVRHSVYSREGSTNDFNLGQYDVGVVKHVTFENTGVSHLACNVHTEMSGYILTLQNPYYAMTDKKGNFEIQNVPAGTWNLTFFHEKIQPATIEVTVSAGQIASAEFAGLKRK